MSTPNDQLPVSLSCTGTTAKATVAIISQLMPRAGLSRSVLWSSSAFTVIAASTSTGI